MSIVNYISEAKGNKEKILAFVTENPHCGSDVICRKFGFTASHCSMYLHRLMRLGLVTQDKQPGMRPLWTAVDLDKVTSMEAKRIIRSTWSDKPRRDYLVAAFFGDAA